MEKINGLPTTLDQTILIVDDDLTTCSLLEILFRSRGYTTKIVNRGQDAVECIEISEPDIVILDVMMPEMDGWETFTKIRSRSKIPVLFLSAVNSGDAAARAISLGVSDYMRKPYSPQELLARIAALLQNGAPKPEHLQEISGLGSIKHDIPITVIIPAFNEERFIGSTVLKAREYADYVIVVDDGSGDRTAEVAEAAGAEVVRHSCNQGKGVALNTGFGKARDLGATVVVTLDADGQHLPEEVEHVVRPILTGEADIVIGSRYLVPGCNVPKPRVWGHRFFNQLTRITSGVAVTDSQSGYRAFSPAAIQAVSFCSNGFSVESEMQFIAHENHLRLVEVPITILYNDKPKRSVISQGLHVLGGVVQITGQYRPLLYFGVTGILLMLAGLGLAVHVYVRYEDVHLLATGNALVSLLLTIVGTVLFSTGFTLHSIRGLLTDRLKTPPKRSRGGLFWKLK